jgi:transcriptional accessory protein Tex/SPT6
MSQLTGLNEFQAQACDEALNKTQFIPYHKLYALNHAQGLTTQQWQKAYQFKKEYDFLKGLCSEHELHTLLSSQDKFLAFDVLMKSPAQHPNTLNSFDEKNLLSDAKKIISQPTHPLEINEETQKAMQYALAIDLFNNAKLLHQIRKKIWENGQFHLHMIHKNNEQTKSLISEWPTKLLIKKIDPILFLKFWQAKKNNQVDADFKLENLDDGIFQILADHLSWKPQNNPADSWIHKALTLAVEVYFYPRIKRDILAICYDHAVEQLLPIVETQWRQLL